MSWANSIRRKNSTFKISLRIIRSSTIFSKRLFKRRLSTISSMSLILRPRQELSMIHKDELWDFMSSSNSYKAQAVTAAPTFITLLPQKSYQISLQSKVIKRSKMRRKSGNQCWSKIYRDKTLVLPTKDGSIFSSRIIISFVKILTWSTRAVNHIQ